MGAVRCLNIPTNLFQIGPYCNEQRKMVWISSQETRDCEFGCACSWASGKMLFGDESFLHMLKSWQYHMLFSLNFYFSKCYTFAFSDLVHQSEGMPHTLWFPLWMVRLRLKTAGWKLYQPNTQPPLLQLSLLLWNNCCYVDKPSTGLVTSAISRVPFSWDSFQ